MEELIIGKTRIPVTIRPNKRLKGTRLSVDQNGVLVEVPNNYPNSKVIAFLENRKEWLFSQWEHFRHKRLQNVWPEHFVSGAKIMYLGRMNLITVKEGPANKVHYSVRGFEVEATSDRKSDDLRPLFIEFFQNSLDEILDEVIASNGKLSQFVDLQVKFTQRQDRWAYCDEKNVIHLGWDLAVLPKKLIEYVLVHELCHLIHRDHSTQFWASLGAILPDFDLRQKMLSDFESQIEI